MGKTGVATIAMVARVPDEPGEYVGDRRMTFEEYLALDHRGLAEWIDGEVHFYVGASTAHQSLILFLASLLEGFLLTTGSGRVFTAPLVVRATARGHGREPDIMVVLEANQDRIRKTYVDGPPDILVEVVSDDSVERDYETKQAEYAAAGVAEYWIIDPREGSFDALFLVLRGSRYEAAPIVDRMFHSEILPDFWLRTDWLQEERPAVFAKLREILGERMP